MFACVRSSGVVVARQDQSQGTVSVPVDTEQVAARYSRQRYWTRDRALEILN